MQDMCGLDPENRYQGAPCPLFYPACNDVQRHRSGNNQQQDRRTRKGRYR
jgi:hypothetical protein